MKVEEYIKKDVLIEGYGRIGALKLDRAFFDSMEFTNGKIKDVLEITGGTGGILPPFGGGKIEGCIIVFESDGEYVDVFCGGSEAK